MLDIEKDLKYIEIETCSSCTRTCKWCSFGNFNDFRNFENKLLETKYIIKIFEELKERKFNGKVAFYSINEPLLDERITSGKLISMCKDFLKEEVYISIITNGDLLELQVINNLYDAGLDQLIVSIYDDYTYNKIFNYKKSYNDIKILDQRRYNIGQWEYNRAGAIDCINKPKSTYNSCYMPFFRTVVGWDGEVRICPHETLNKLRFGNIKHEKLFDILTKKEFMNFRETLVNRRETLSPCKDCNVDGSLEYMLEHITGIYTQDLNRYKNLIV